MTKDVMKDQDAEKAVSLDTYMAWLKTEVSFRLPRFVLVLGGIVAAILVIVALD